MPKGKGTYGSKTIKTPSNARWWVIGKTKKELKAFKKDASKKRISKSNG